MPIEHPEPTEATVKQLYAHAFGCAFEGCRRTLYRLNDETGTRTLNSRVCHINARREGGPRWNPDQSPEDNRSQQNLILMCVEHAALIDIPETLSAYPRERLHEWKRKQLEEYDRIQQGWILDSDMAREAIEASSSEIFVSNSTIKLGGEGGKAPGAGGGGGGAIGRGAQAGRGGDGGGHRIDNGDYALPMPEDYPTFIEIDEFLKSTLDHVPGVGGGGEGVIGDGAIAGNGGNGGECVSGIIDISEMRKDGLHKIEVTVGKGGTNGGDGEDSILRFLTEDGRVLKTIRAAGGKGGASALPDGVVEITLEDIKNNLRVSTLMTANAVDIRDNLMFLLGADWVNVFVPHVPFDMTWPIIFVVRWKPCEWEMPRGFFLSLLRPDGREVSRQGFFIPKEADAEGYRRYIQHLGVKLDAEGVWTLKIHSGGFVLARIEVNIIIKTLPSA